MSLLESLHKIDNSMEIGYVLIRTIIVYIYAIFLIRFGNKRAQLNTPFDFIFIVIIGAILGRTIYGGASLSTTILASFTLILLHWLFAVLAFKYHLFGKVIKGYSQILVKEGVLDWENMKGNQITKEDLIEAFRKEMHTDDLNKIKEAHLERTGSISFIPKDS